MLCYFLLMPLLLCLSNLFSLSLSVCLSLELFISVSLTVSEGSIVSPVDKTNREFPAGRILCCLIVIIRMMDMTALLSNQKIRFYLEK